MNSLNRSNIHSKLGICNENFKDCYKFGLKTAFQINFCTQNCSRNGPIYLSLKKFCK